MNPSTIEIVATVLFGLAIMHTFLVKRFETLAHRYPEGSIGENAFHLLGEVEVVFGIWATAFLIIFTLLIGGPHVIDYLESRYVIEGAKNPVGIQFIEPMFVFAIMTMAATRPVLQVAEGFIRLFSKLLPIGRDPAFFASCLVIGPILGSFITEPAAMTVTALLLKRGFYDRGISKKLMYATIGLLFVNISIGGTLTQFAAPPVVMVASKWNLDMAYMFTHFGWKAAIAILISTAVVTAVFLKELRSLPAAVADDDSKRMRVPVGLMIIHLALIAGVVITSHHPAAFMGFFLLFLGIATVTKEYQDDLKVREALLVAYFLMGLVVLGGMQTWWLQPTLTSMSDIPLYFGATGLTAVTDNAALTFLGSQVEGLSEASKYALLAGAVTGGGLTVIANAPNPAGYGILKSSFGETGISPLGLLASALPPTIVAILAFLLLPNL